ncbi:MAG: vancomycin high temperature exclusion protein [Acutalibacteraceae bacterium]
MKRRKKIKKAALAFVVAVCILTVYVLSVNFYIIGSAQKYIVSRNETAFLKNIDCVLVLGCGVRPDGSPSDMLGERIQEGSETFKVCSADYLFLTGDGSSRDGYDEPAVMKQVCMENYGIAEEKIMTDAYGLSTYDSIANAKKNGAERIIIITQSYHMPRALFIARQLGLEAYGVEAHLLRYPAQILWSAREVLARNKDFLKCIL